MDGKKENVEESANNEKESDMENDKTIITNGGSKFGGSGNEGKGPNKKEDKIEHTTDEERKLGEEMATDEITKNNNNMEEEDDMDDDDTNGSMTNSKRNKVKASGGQDNQKEEEKEDKNFETEKRREKECLRGKS